MKLGVCPQPFYRGSLEDALDAIADLGFDGLELPVNAGNPFVDLDTLATTAGADSVRRMLDERHLELTALSIHQDGQLLLGPHHSDTDRMFSGSPAEKVEFAAHRLRKSAQAAKRLGVTIVVGFVGCEDYTRFFPWPDENGWEKMLPTFRERMLPLLDEFAQHGVRFAHEPHPKQIVYNVETALESVAVLDRHDAWGFNLDPANLVLAGCDPVVFVAELGDRIHHVHAKDAELVAHNAARSGLLAHGRWDRKDRGFRFRVAGWGDINWKRLISELVLANYDGWMTVEHEDPIFAPIDGLKKALDMLRPLRPTAPREERWW